MKKLFKITLLLTTLLSLSACSNVKNFYANYINPPAKMNYNNPLITTPSQAHLSDNLVLVGEELSAFQKHFDLIIHPPQANDLANLLSAYPWIGGAMVVNPSGTVTGAYPENYPHFNFNALLELPKKADERAIRVNVQDNAIIVSKPVFDTTDAFLGLSIIYFDIKKLMAQVAFADDIVVIAANDATVLSSHSITTGPLSTIDFKKKTKKTSSDSVSNKEGEAYWLALYFYNYPLVFAIIE